MMFAVTLALAAWSPPAQPAAADGREIFRFDTFGDEQLWTGVLQMHQALQTVTPKTALSVGLKIDVDALPAPVRTALQNNQVNLDDPNVTVSLLQVNAVVGVKAAVAGGKLTSVGITCALCHSNVDDSFAPSIGKRLDGWANPSLNVGAIAALSPVLDEATRAAFQSWGPGKYDPRHHYFDGEKIVPLHETTIPVDIPAIYGLRGVEFETFTGDGPISYWNAYVGVGQMGGQGNFSDPRIGINISQSPDLVTPKLEALLAYQLSLRAPRPPSNTVNQQAAGRGRVLFRNQAGCARCHQSPNFTDVVDPPGKSTPFLHGPSEAGTNGEYAQRSATKQYRTTPLRALFQHAPYFHDGSAKDLAEVVEHYDEHFRLNLTVEQKADLVEYLKSL
jgi:hypothetical protein